MRKAVLYAPFDSYGGACWCIAACPRSTTLLVGCEDGARIFDFATPGEVRYQRSIPSTGCRVLSVAFHPVNPRIYLGCEDGTIRCIDQISLAALQRLTGNVTRGLSVHIFSLVVLSDSTVRLRHYKAKRIIFYIYMLSF